MMKWGDTHDIGSLDVEEDCTVSGDEHFHDDVVQEPALRASSSTREGRNDKKMTYHDGTHRLYGECHARGQLGVLTLNIPKCHA
jgi:hypothetical protein